MEPMGKHKTRSAEAAKKQPAGAQQVRRATKEKSTPKGKRKPSDLETIRSGLSSIKKFLAA
jgi:hypothetical protein